MSISNANYEKVEEVYAGIKELIKLTKGEDNPIITGAFNVVIEDRVDDQAIIIGLE